MEPEKCKNTDPNEKKLMNSFLEPFVIVVFGSNLKEKGVRKDSGKSFAQTACNFFHLNLSSHLFPVIFGFFPKNSRSKPEQIDI